MGNDWQSNYNQWQQQQHNYRVESQLNNVQMQLAFKNSGSMQIASVGSSRLNPNAYWFSFGLPVAIIFFVDVLTLGGHRDPDIATTFRTIYLSYFALWALSQYARPQVMKRVPDDSKTAILHATFLFPLLVIGFANQSFFITPIFAIISFILNNKFIAKYEAEQILAGLSTSLKKWFSSGKTLDDKINLNPIKIYIFEMPLLNDEGVQILKKNGFDFSSLTLFHFQFHILSGYLNGNPKYSLGTIKTLITEVVDPRSFSVSSRDKKIGANSIDYVRLYKQPDAVDAKNFEIRKNNLLNLFNEYIKKNEASSFKIVNGDKWVSQDSIDLSEFEHFDFESQQWKPIQTAANKKGGLSWRNRGAS